MEPFRNLGVNLISDLGDFVLAVKDTRSKLFVQRRSPRDFSLALKKMTNQYIILQGIKLNFAERKFGLQLYTNRIEVDDIGRNQVSGRAMMTASEPTAEDDHVDESGRAANPRPAKQPRHS